MKNLKRPHIAPLPAPLSMRDPAVLIATGFGSGRMAPAPGTWGSVAAWLIGLCMPKTLLLAGIVLATLAGLWAVRRMEQKSGLHDAGMIVIDEWAGVWIAMLFATPAMPSLLLALLAFRFFDILKPWPIGWLDKNVSGAAGVMVDDLLAGLFAGLCVWGANLWMNL